MLAEPLILRDRQPTFTLTILAALDSFVRIQDGKHTNQLLLIFRKIVAFLVLRVTRQNSIIAPAAGSNGWRKSTLSSSARSRRQRSKKENHRSLALPVMVPSLF